MTLYATEHRNFRMQTTRTLYEGGELLVCKGSPVGVLQDPASGDLLSQHTLTGGVETEGVLEYQASDVSVDVSAVGTGDPTYLLIKDVVGKIQALYNLPTDASFTINNGAQIVAGESATVNSFQIVEGNG